MERTSRLRISLLGELTAAYDGRPLDLGGRRQRAVLARLVVARGDVVPAESLADAVWGEQPPRDVPGALQSYVSHLRRGLHPGLPARARSEVIVRQGPGYALHLPDADVDAWCFEDLLRRAEEQPRPEDTVTLLVEALALWRGPALVEYADDPWAQAEIARLAELRTLGRERLVAARLEVEDPGLLVPDLESLVAEDPLREERWRLLALTLYRAHRQADALAALRRARDVLAEELGVDPGPALRQLESEVLAQSPSLTAPRRPAPEPRPAAPEPDDAEPLVERDTERAALAGLLDGLLEGRSGLVVVEGPAGLGKTRLLREARRLATGRSVRVLSARGSQLESSFAYGVVRQLFDQELTDRERRAALLGGAAQGARSVFDADTDQQVDGFGVLHGLTWLTANLASEGPVVLLVDDAQWCDGASLRFLGFLARRLASWPVALLVAIRTGGEPGPQDDLLAELSLDPDAQVLRPAVLSEAATAHLVEHQLLAPPDRTFTSACHRTTSGNPLLLSQLLRALATQGVRPDASHADTVVAVGSRAISSMVLVRLRRLPEDATAVAQAAAVLGDGAVVPQLAALSRLPDQRVASALAALARAELVADEQPVSFVHPLVRDAVYQALPAAERGLRHEQAAHVLRTAGASDEQVAAHLLLAPPRGDQDVVTLLQRAGRASAARGAADSAVTYLRRALAEPPRRPRRAPRPPAPATRCCSSSACSRHPWTAPRPSSTCSRPTGATPIHGPAPRSRSRPPPRRSSPVRPASPPRSPAMPRRHSRRTSPTSVRHCSPCNG